MRGWALSTSYTVISLLLLLDVNCYCKSKVHVLEQQEGCAHFTFAKDERSEILKVQWEQKKKKSFIVQVTFVLLIRLPGDLTWRSELWMKCCVCRASEQQLSTHGKKTNSSSKICILFYGHEPWGLKMWDDTALPQSVESFSFHIQNWFLLVIYRL